MKHPRLGFGAPGSTTPPASQTVDGRIVLPAGHGLDLASLVATTPIGRYPVGADGAFTADVFAGASQSGVRVLQNPSGAGVVARNGFRRPAALLAYEVAWETADGALTPIDPPVLAERVDVPATGQLEALEAIFDVLTGDAPWSPVLSPAMHLAGRANASRTHDQLVLLGPSTSTTVPPIMGDARFAGFHDEWDDIVMEKSLELFLDELLLPLVEVYGLGSLAKYDAAKLTQLRTRVRAIADEHLLGLGVYLRAGRSGYADALRFAIARLVERERNRGGRADRVGRRRRRQARARPRRLHGGGGVDRHLDACALRALARASDRLARQRFRPIHRDAQGDHVPLPLNHQRRPRHDQRPPERRHDHRHGFERDLVLPRSPARHRGRRRRLDRRGGVRGRGRRVDHPGRRRARGAHGGHGPRRRSADRRAHQTGARHDAAQDFRLDGPNHDLFMDLAAKSGGGIVDAGYVLPYNGACRWRRDGYDTAPPSTLFVRYDAQEEQFVVNLFVNLQHGYGTPSRVALPLWYDWVEHATFEVVVQD